MNIIGYLTLSFITLFTLSFFGIRVIERFVKGYEDTEEKALVTVELFLGFIFLSLAWPITWVILSAYLLHLVLKK